MLSGLRYAAGGQHCCALRAGPGATTLRTASSKLQHRYYSRMWQAWNGDQNVKHRVISLLNSTDKDNAAGATATREAVRELCDSGLPDTELCEIAVAPPKNSVIEEATSRGKWLLGLLILQSTSSFVMEQYQVLLKEHLVVTLFLTMLVGAGGNAGNQSAIKVIRSLAIGSIQPSWESMRNTLQEQVMVGLLLGTGLSCAGWLRVYATNGDALNASAISLSLMMIVMTSVVLGTALPFGLTKIGVDPANAGTSIQVIMDIMGVAITCFTCNLILVQFAISLA